MAKRLRWRLDKDDERELLKWVEQSGLERVARIAAALTDASGDRGVPDKLHTLALLRIAHLKRDYPRRTLHNIAVEVAKEFHSARIPFIALESLISALERQYRSRRSIWNLLTNKTKRPEIHEIISDAKLPIGTEEHRARARIVNNLPNSIDLYEDLLSAANQKGPEQLKLIRTLGRERVEPILKDTLNRVSVEGASLNIFLTLGLKRIPRDNFELIEPQLLRLRGSA